MKLIPFALLLFSCKSSVTHTPIKENPSKIVTGLDSSISELQKAQTRFYTIMSLVHKRDSFFTKKLENEVLYYQTGNDLYRRRGNRLIDSGNKYVLIIDSIKNQLN